MLRFVVLSAAVMALGCQAAGYGSGTKGGSSGGRSMGGGYGGGGASMSMGYGMSGGSMPVQAAIHSRHSVQYKDVESTGMVQPTSIEIGASHIPLNFIFRSASSQLNVQQKHEGAEGSTQESNSEDEPHYLRHTVTKPINQEVKELIMPYRKITQEIKPVQEIIETLIARQAMKSGGGYGAMSGYGSSSMGGSGMSAKYGGGGGSSKY